ncbi:MAG TPA: biotin transporter BioY [Candidatus Thermoplasmatota archaeon]|nr:biotin transporter BioY [Candidatus Thermoplasmatota archaeon]
MDVTLSINNYKLLRYRFFKWRYELGFSYKLMLAFSFACLTGLLAQVRLYLPWSPVPLTGQTFAVVLGAVVLGKWWGGISQSLYLGVGLLGMPWFAGFHAGFSYLLGPTGGYLIGFIIASFFLGYFMDEYVKSRRYLTMFALMLVANFGIVFGLGLLGLYGWVFFTTGTAVDLWTLLMMGLIPFLVGDIVKIAVAAGVAGAITPKHAYGHELDAST